MRIFKNKMFFKWAKSEGLNDATLMKAAKEIDQGLIDANLGSNLVKKRIARKGQGRANEVDLGPSWFFKKSTELFLFMGFQKTLATILMSKRKRH